MASQWRKNGGFILHRVACSPYKPIVMDYSNIASTRVPILKISEIESEPLCDVGGISVHISYATGKNIGGYCDRPQTGTFYFDFMIACLTMSSFKLMNLSPNEQPTQKPQKRAK